MSSQRHPQNSPTKRQSTSQRGVLRWQTIQHCRNHFPIGLMYRGLKVPVSGYYAWVSHPEPARARANQHLLSRTREIDDKSSCMIGSPRRHEDLVAKRVSTSHNRVARLMAKHGIQGWLLRKRGRLGCLYFSPAGYLESSRSEFLCSGAGLQVGDRYDRNTDAGRKALPPCGSRSAQQAGRWLAHASPSRST